MKKDLFTMLEALINDDIEGAKKAFHSHMITKSRKVVMKEADEDMDMDHDEDMGAMGDHDMDADDMGAHMDDEDMGDHDEDMDDMGEEPEEDELKIRFDATKDCYVVSLGDETVELGGETKEEATAEAEQLYGEYIAEKWARPAKLNPKKKGMFDGWTLTDLRKELASLKASGPHKKGSAKFTKQNEVEMAIRAKQKGGSKWGRVKESDETLEEAKMKKPKKEKLGKKMANGKPFKVKC